MSRNYSIYCGALVLLAAFAGAQTARPVTPGQRQPANMAPQGNTVPQPQLSSPPPIIAQPQAQPSPANPPVAPVVTYRDGQLTVQALNASLSSVIAAIRSKTGIEFEGAEGISERVALSLGPAPEGEILAAIFSGSKFDYVAIGRADSPGIVQRVILTARNRTSGPGEGQAQPARVANPDGDDDSDANDDQGGGDPQDTPAQPPPVPQTAPPPQAQSQPKTPDQLLQELQEMRRQKQSPPNGDPASNQAPRKIPPQ